MPARHHDHLIDMSTGKGIEFHSRVIEDLQATVAKELGYFLVDYRLELFGTRLTSSVHTKRD